MSDFYGKAENYKGECKLCARIRASTWRANNREKCRESVWKADLKRRCREYGITVEGYYGIKDNQNGACGICGKTPSGDEYDLAIDHCHVTNKVRGLLCGRCNTAMERVDNIQGWVEKAIAYKLRAQ